MKPSLPEKFFHAVKKKSDRRDPPPLLTELFGTKDGKVTWDYESYPFFYRVSHQGSAPLYVIGSALTGDVVLALRDAVEAVSSSLDPREVEPLTFGRLVEVLTQRSAQQLASVEGKNKVRALSELAAYEAIGLSRILAISRDQRVTEFYADSDNTPLYLDHTTAGRCESAIFLTQRERDALVTHVDTFSGYTLDFKTPSMKNDLQIGGAILRVSIDLEPVAVNHFALDVRRLNISSLTLPELIGLNVLSEEAASLLIGWLEVGGNLTIVGETGTGKTTLLNALDEQVERRLRRLYIEDAVETRDLLARGFHQLKVKVDPFERGSEAGRTKESEIVKALHRSPDMVILSEIQTEEHSRAFFQALAAGARGIQTFHASTVEQAVRRWLNMHHVSEQSLLDLGLIVQMARPDRLSQQRLVWRICAMTQAGGAPSIKEVFARDSELSLRNVAGVGWPPIPNGTDPSKLILKMDEASRKIGAGPLRK